MITKKERDILKEAGQIITRELAAKREVKVPGFGKFYLTKISVEAWSSNTQLAWGNDMGEFYDIHAVKFRPWTKLKKATRKIVAPLQKMSIMAARKRA